MLGDTDCFNFVLMDANGTVLALTATKDDKYAPKKTGVYDVNVQPLLRTWNAQKWRYDAKKKAFYSQQYHPNAVISEGANKNLFLYKYLGLNIQKFSFDQKTGIFRNLNSKRVATVGKTEIKRRTYAADILD